MTVPVSDGAGPPTKLRDRGIVIVGEFAVVALLFVADVYRLVPLSKTPFLLALAWISLRVRKVEWRSLGWERPRHWVSALSFGVLAGCAIELLELSVTHPFLSWLTGRPPDLSDFGSLEGNLPLFLVALVLIWGLAAIGEEVVYIPGCEPRTSPLARRPSPCYTLNTSDASRIPPCTDISIDGHPGVDVISSTRPSTTSAVSSIFVPVIDGFHANAWRAWTTSCERGCATHSRARYPVAPP
jgi:hypothetical protein